MRFTLLVGKSFVVTSVRTDKLRSVWESRVDQWEATVETSEAFARVRDRMLELAKPRAADRCLDLGAGTGMLTLPLADQVAAVTAADISAGMLASLAAAAQHDRNEVATRTAPMEELHFAAASFELVVSNYAMHYLTHADKDVILRRIRRWLVPGGRLVIGDMMIGRSLDEHHRRVLWEKGLVMLRRGPAGWWRLLKNIMRIGTGKGRLRPAAPEWWTTALAEAGFEGVRYEHVVSEAGIVTGTTPFVNSTM